MTNKTITTITVAVSIFASTLAPAVTHAAKSSDLRMIPVIVNGYKVKFPDTEPYVDTNGRTMVPVRFVSEKLGANVAWNDSDYSVTITYGDKVINLPIDSNEVTVNGEKTTLDTEAVLEEGRTMVPLRFVSETLSSTVKWDEDAHAVQVIDKAYMTKVANGEVYLDAWGRELSKTWDANWNRLSDLPEEFYSTVLSHVSGDMTNKVFMDGSRDWTGKKFVDIWGNRVRSYYATQLNVDYRTIDEDKFIADIMPNMSWLGKHQEYSIKSALSKYVKWVKDNKVIAKGYADPENSMVRYEWMAPVVRTHFKFMVISANNANEALLDRLASAADKSLDIKMGVWYDGYADVQLDSRSGNFQEYTYAVKVDQHMFMNDKITQKAKYVYKEIIE